MATAPLLDDDELQKIYVWVDSVPLSRPKRNIARDFSDGVLVAELVHHYFPKLVELHNYSAANSVRQKLYNWATLNQRVLRRLDFEVKRPDVEAIVNCKPGIIEAVLMQLQQKVADYRARRINPSAGETSSPAAGGYDSARQHGGGGGGEETTFASYGAAARAAAAQPQHALQGTSLSGGGGGGAPDDDVAGLLAEKDAAIADLRETLEITELKVKKLEQLVRLKDSRIQTLTTRLQQGMQGPV